MPAPPEVRRELRSVDDVDELVRRFYQAVIPDPVLGPIFHAMDVAWSEHIPKLVDFWSLRLFGIAGYAGNAAGAHLPVFDRCPFGTAELDRWLDLWEETIDELFVGDAAELAKQRAHMAAAAIATLVTRVSGSRAPERHPISSSIRTRRRPP
jgi:hemoglobin